jgi:hypothetical protein
MITNAMEGGSCRICLQSGVVVVVVGGEEEEEEDRSIKCYEGNVMVLLAANVECDKPLRAPFPSITERHSTTSEGLAVLFAFDVR